MPSLPMFPGLQLILNFCVARVSHLSLLNLLFLVLVCYYSIQGSLWILTSVIQLFISSFPNCAFTQVALEPDGQVESPVALLAGPPSSLGDYHSCLVLSSLKPRLLQNLLQPLYRIEIEI